MWTVLETLGMLKYEPKWGERGGNDLAFYCQSSVGTIPFQGRVFLLLTFCKQNSSLQQLLSHMATVCLSTNCPRANSMIKRSWPHGLEKVEHELGIGCYHNFHHKISARKGGKGVCSGVCSGLCFWIFYIVVVPLLVVIIGVDDVDVVDALFSAGKFVFEVISTALPSAHAACRRPVSFLRMMQHWIMAPGFQPKERPAN